MEPWLLAIIIIASTLVGIFILLVIFGLIIIFCSYHSKFLHKTAEGFIKSPQEEFAYQADAEWFFKDGFFEKVEGKSFDKLDISAYFHKEENSHLYIVFAHGYSGAPQEKAKCLHRLYDHYHCNIMSICQRGHGDSKAKFTTMGYKEGKDLIYWTNYITSMDKDAKIVTFGESMGAATVLYGLEFGYNENVKCVIEDAGYSSISKVQIFVAHDNQHIPMIFTKIGVFGTVIAFFLFFKMRIIKHSPVNAIKKKTIPVCFIHGDKDQVVPYESFLIFKDKINPNTKAIFESFKDTIHCASFANDEERYLKIICKFINESII